MGGRGDEGEDDKSEEVNGLLTHKQRGKWNGRIRMVRGWEGRKK